MEPTYNAEEVIEHANQYPRVRLDAQGWWKKNQISYWIIMSVHWSRACMPKKNANLSRNRGMSISLMNETRPARMTGHGFIELEHSKQQPLLATSHHIYFCVVVSNIFYMFTLIWGRFPFWLIFSNGLKPPTRLEFRLFGDLPTHFDLFGRRRNWKEQFRLAQRTKSLEVQDT